MDLDNTHLYIDSRDKLLSRTGLNAHQLNRLVEDGLFPPSIKFVGVRREGWLEREANLLLAAYARKAPEPVVRELVQRLIKDRESLTHPVLEAAYNAVQVGGAA